MRRVDLGSTWMPNVKEPRIKIVSCKHLCICSWSPNHTLQLLVFCHPLVKFMSTQTWTRSRGASTIDSRQTTEKCIWNIALQKGGCPTQRTFRRRSCFPGWIRNSFTAVLDIGVGTGDFIMVLSLIHRTSFNVKGKVTKLTRVPQLDAHSNNQSPLDH